MLVKLNFVFMYCYINFCNTGCSPTLYLIFEWFDPLYRLTLKIFHNEYTLSCKPVFLYWWGKFCAMCVTKLSTFVCKTLHSSRCIISHNWQNKAVYNVYLIFLQLWLVQPRCHSQTQTISGKTASKAVSVKKVPKHLGHITKVFRRHHPPWKIPDKAKVSLPPPGRSCLPIAWPFLSLTLDGWALLRMPSILPLWYWSRKMAGDAWNSSPLVCWKHWNHWLE